MNRRIAMNVLMAAKELLRCIEVACLCALLLAGFVLVLSVPRIVHSEAEATRAMVASQVHIAVVDANGRVADALEKMDAQVTTGLADVHQASVNADRRTGEALSIVRTAAGQANLTMAGAELDLGRLTSDTNSQMGTLNATVAATLKPVAETAQQVDDALPLFADCEFNPDCAFNRFQGVSKAFETTSIAIAKAAPSVVSSVDKMAASSAGIANSADVAAKGIIAPKTKWQQFLMWLQLGARLAGDFY